MSTITDHQAKSAIKATARLITDDEPRVISAGLDPLPADEVIVEPAPEDYLPPPFLRKTAPQLVPSFESFLGELRDLNTLFAGERTVDAQATLSLTGDHDALEERFLGWCQHYFKLRGNPGRLNPQNQNNPFLLYKSCYEEFSELCEKRLVQPGTINSSVLNLSQRFMKSAFADLVVGPHLREIVEPSSHPDLATTGGRCIVDWISDYREGIWSFTTFLSEVLARVPSEYAPVDSQEWRDHAQARLIERAEDLIFLRYVLAPEGNKGGDDEQLTPEITARFSWDVYHGSAIGSIVPIATGDTPDDRTRHPIAVRRDGCLSHREFSWVRVEPGYRPEERWTELAANWYVLDRLTSSLYEAWDRLDPGPVIARGLEPGSTEQEETAALTVAVADFDPDVVDTPTKQRPRLPRLRMSRIRSILTREFGCEWSQAKGSEQKVFRPGGRVFTFGCHGTDRWVDPGKLKDCLRRLDIPLKSFIEKCQ